MEVKIEVRISDGRWRTEAPNRLIVGVLRKSGETTITIRRSKEAGESGWDWAGNESKHFSPATPHPISAALAGSFSRLRSSHVGPQMYACLEAKNYPH